MRSMGSGVLGASHFEINGPNIRTPGGNDITGNYDRHGFHLCRARQTRRAPGTQIVMALSERGDRAGHARDIGAGDVEAV